MIVSRQRMPSLLGAMLLCLIASGMAGAGATGGCRGRLALLGPQVPAFEPPSISSETGARAYLDDRSVASASIEAPRGRSGNASAVLTALMSAVLPGAGQIRNGSILRGIGFAAVEVGGWVAYFSFRQGGEDRLDEVARLADSDWDYERYFSRAQHPDSCFSCGCPDGDRFDNDNALISDSMAGGGTRFYEHLIRDAYGCGWSSAVSQSIYRGLWDDREDMQNAQRWSGRLIFLNHLVAAVDAFLEARSTRLRLDERTDVRLDLEGLPTRVHPTLCVTHHF